MKHYFKYHFPWQLIMGIIFVLSSIPEEGLPKIEYKFADKIAHFILYGILGIIFFRALISSQRFILQKYSVFLAVLICSAYGALDEVHQLYVPGRFASLSDWIADLLGILCFVLFYKHLTTRKRNSVSDSVKTQKTEQERAGDRK